MGEGQRQEVKWRENLSVVQLKQLFGASKLQFLATVCAGLIRQRHTLLIPLLDTCRRALLQRAGIQGCVEGHLYGGNDCNEI